MNVAGGVARDCFVYGHYDLVQSAHFRRSLYDGCMIAVGCISFIALFYQQLVSGIGLIVMITGFAAMILVHTSPQRPPSVVRGLGSHNTRGRQWSCFQLSDTTPKKDVSF